MINLSDTSPAPPSGKANIKWQKDPTGLVSGYVDSVGTLTIPGPFADDTAAASGGVALNSPYYLSTGFMVVRLVMVLFVALLCAGRASAQTHVNAIANGGTGQSTRQSAFDGLAPAATVAGTITFYDGSHWVKLDGNTSGTQCFEENSSGVPTWAACGGSMVYPGAGIPVSTGSAWGTSIAPSGAKCYPFQGTGGTGCDTPSGGGSPGGSNTQVQYNNSGAFGGITNLKTDGTNPIATEITTPSAPSSGTQAIYVRAGVGICSKDSSGIEYCVGSNGQSACWTDLSPSTSHDGRVTLINWQSAIHITRFSCGITGSTSAVGNLTKGGNALISPATCTAGDANQVVVTTFANGSGQCGSTTKCAVAAQTPVVVNEPTLTGSPTSFTVCANFTVDQ